MKKPPAANSTPPSDLLTVEVVREFTRSGKTLPPGHRFQVKRKYQNVHVTRWLSEGRLKEVPAPAEDDAAPEPSKPGKVGIQDLSQGRRNVFLMRVEDCVVDEGFNTRTDFAGQQELVESIRVNGVRVPLLGRMGPDGKFHVTDGHRRLFAARALLAENRQGEPAIEILLPVLNEPTHRNAAGQLVAALPDDQRTAAILTSNSGKPLNIFEQGAAMQRLAADHGWENARIAREAGCSLTHVANCLKLVNGACHDLKLAVTTGGISPTTAIDLILACPGDDEQTLAVEEAWFNAQERDPQADRLTAKDFNIPLGKKRQDAQRKPEAEAKPEPAPARINVYSLPEYSGGQEIQVDDPGIYESIERTCAPAVRDELVISSCFNYGGRFYSVTGTASLPTQGGKRCQESRAHELLQPGTPYPFKEGDSYEGKSRILNGQRLLLGPAIIFRHGQKPEPVKPVAAATSSVLIPGIETIRFEKPCRLTVEFHLAQNAAPRWRVGYAVRVDEDTYACRRPVGAGESFADREEALLAGLQELLTAARDPSNHPEWKVIAEECENRIRELDQPAPKKPAGPGMLGRGPDPEPPAAPVAAAGSTPPPPLLWNVFQALPEKGCDPERYRTLQAAIAFLSGRINERALIEFVTGLSDEF